MLYQFIGFVWFAIKCNTQKKIIPFLFLTSDEGEDPNMYTIKLHYNGWWVFDPEMNYIGGQIDYYDYCNGGENSIIHMRQLMKKLNVNDRKVKFWF